MSTVGVMSSNVRETDWIESVDPAEEAEDTGIERANTWGSLGNQLKLSVGGADDESESAHSTEDLTACLQAWHLRSSPAPIRSEHNEQLPSISCDEDFSPSAIGRLLDEGQPLFQPFTPAHNLIEETWVVKQPKIINGYLFGAVIGEGSYAKVKEVVEEETLVRRAVKIFKDSRLRKIPNGAENVQRERQILEKLDHPNCVKMIEFFRIDEKHKQYMIMEFCIASLQQVLDGSPGNRLSESRSHNFFCQLIAGVDYLHSRGVVHKDIKPGNLLLTQNATVKLSDFGVAQQLDLYMGNDECTVAQGTPKFQPPEVVSGTNSSFSGFAVDVWASAVTLYNLISGEYPFEGEVIMRLFDNIVHQPLRMPTAVDVDDCLKRLLVGMLDKDSRARLKIYQVIDHAWFRKSFHVEPFDWAEVFKEEQSHRPLSVYGFLEQMYANQGIPIEDAHHHVQDSANRPAVIEPESGPSSALIESGPGAGPRRDSLPRTRSEPASHPPPQQESDTTPPRRKRSCFFLCFR